MRFSDAFDLVRADVPLGWGYDPISSGLDTVVFRRWNNFDERLAVWLNPTAVTPEHDDDAWLQAIRGRSSFYGDAHLAGRAGALPIAGVRVPDSETNERTAIVRGPRLDVSIRHRGGVDTSEVLTAPILALTSRLVIPANDELPEATTEAAIAEVQEAVLAASDPSDRDVHVGRLLELARSGTVHGLLNSDGDLIAAGCVSWGTFFLFEALFHDELIASYLAEQAIVRTLVSLAREPESPDDVTIDKIQSLRLRLHRQLIERPDLAPLLPGLFSVLRALDPAWVSDNDVLTRPLTPLDAAMMYSGAFVSAGQEFAAQVQPLKPFPLASLAAEIPASLLVGRQAVGVQEVLSSVYESFGLSTLYDGLNSVQRADERALGSPLRIDFTELQVAITRRRQELDPDDDELGYLLAEDLARLAIARARLTEPKAVAESRALIDEARAHVDAHTPSGTRMYLELGDAAVSIREHAPLNGVIEALSQANEFAQTSNPDLLRELRAQLATMLCQEGRVDEAAALLQPSIEPNSVYSNTDIPVDVLVAEASVATARGDRERAADFLACGLMVQGLDNKLQIGARALLEAAAELVRTSNPDLADEVDRALLAVDRVYGSEEIADEDRRIQFGEEGEQRTRAELIVERLIGRDADLAALEVADDARAVVLRASLGARITDGPVAEPHLPDPTKGFPGHAAIALPLYTHSIRVIAENHLRQRKYPIGLPADDLIRAATDGGHQALIVQPVEDRIYLLHVDTSGTLHAIRSPTSRTTVVQHVAKVRDEFGIQAAPTTRGGNPYLPALRRSRTSWQDSLAELARAFIEPVELSDAPLVIVPYGELALLPWNAIGGSDNPLTKRVALSVAPSLAVLDALRTRRETHAHPTRVLVVADPDTEAHHGLARLPGAQREASALVQSLTKAGVADAAIRALGDLEATEADVRRAAAGADLVHLACHASLRDPVTMSALFLVPGSGDGLLMPGEIRELALQDAFVFLSACETGTGTPTVDGVLGLSRAFLAAGARTVAMSLWPVDDAATSYLVSSFYRHLLGTEHPAQPADQALASAIADLRQDLAADRITSNDGTTLPDHPSLWAPFLVLGDGGYCYGN